MRRVLPFIIVGVVALVAIGSGAMLYHAKRPVPATTVAKPAASVKTRAENLHVRGEHNAPVTLEEFADFQCPPCAMISSALDELEREYHGRLRVVFRNFPLVNHVHAVPAASAAEAAGLQGQFWQMHDLLYREQKVWSKATEVQSVFSSYAGMLGLDVERFKADMQSPAMKAIVEKDRREGEARGVKNTPTLFVNDVMLAPASMNKTGLHDAIDSALKAAASPKPK